MGSLSIWHWLIVLVVVVLIFGTKKLRNLGTDLGGAVKGFKDGMKDGSEKPPEAGAATATATQQVSAAPSAVAISAATPNTSPDALKRSTAAATRTGVRPLMTTRAPSASRPCAMAKPMPAVEPVTSASFPLSPRSMPCPLSEPLLANQP